MKNKEKSSNGSNFFFLTFVFCNLYFTKKIYLGKTQLYLYISITDCLRSGYLKYRNETAMSNIDLQQPCRAITRFGILTQILKGIYHFFEKIKIIYQGKFSVDLLQVAGSTYYRIIFRTIHISKICTKLRIELEKFCLYQSQQFCSVCKSINFTRVFTSKAIIKISGTA